MLLIRHGASAAAIPDAPFPSVDGHGDPPLAPEGHEQARALAARLAGDELSAIFVSGLKRTVETAAPLVERTGLEPVEIPALREVKLGDWEGGELRIRMAQRDPLALRVLAEQRWDVIPNAEPMAEFGARVRAGMEELLAQVEPGTRAALVAHGAVIGELCRHATDSRTFAFVHSDNCSISRLVAFAQGWWLLRSFNDSAHLGG